MRNKIQGLKLVLAMAALGIILGYYIPLLFAQTAEVESNKPIPMVLATPFARWEEIGTITTQQAYPAVGDRDYTTVAALADARTFVWELPSYARKVQMSFQTTANADSTTIALMGFADQYSINTSNALVDDDAVFLGSMVLTGGQQTGKHSNVYVDTIVATDGVCAFAELDSAADRRCVVEFNSKYKIIVGIATTLQGSSTLYAEGRICP
ncbi:MAG: hypothetical protein ACYS8Z_21505 [Planctomycetota bacterium]